MGIGVSCELVTGIYRRRYQGNQDGKEFAVPTDSQGMFINHFIPLHPCDNIFPVFHLRSTQNIQNRNTCKTAVAFGRVTSVGCEMFSFTETVIINDCRKAEQNQDL